MSQILPDILENANQIRKKRKDALKHLSFSFFYKIAYKMLPTTYKYVAETYYETNENSADT